MEDFQLKINTTVYTEKSNLSPYNWGGVNSTKMNPWVSLDAFFVLKEAKRIEFDV